MAEELFNNIEALTNNQEALKIDVNAGRVELMVSYAPIKGVYCCLKYPIKGCGFTYTNQRRDTQYAPFVGA